jgi:hypothetical protein
LLFRKWQLKPTPGKVIFWCNSSSLGKALGLLKASLLEKLSSPLSSDDCCTPHPPCIRKLQIPPVHRGKGFSSRAQPLVSCWGSYSLAHSPNTHIPDIWLFLAQLTSPSSPVLGPAPTGRWKLPQVIASFSLPLGFQLDPPFLRSAGEDILNGPPGKEAGP